MRNIDTIVVHHSVTDKYNKDIWAVSVEGVDYVPGLYFGGKEYKGNYHHLIYWDGEVKSPVPEDRYTYHCGVYDINLESIAVCCIGDYSNEQPSPAALVAAKSVIEGIQNRYSISDIYGHKELMATRCPGDWYDLNIIMEAKMKLDPAIIRKAYLAVLRREPDSDGMNYYLNLDISEAELYYQLAESSEHRTMYDNSVKYLEGGGSEYEEVMEKLYRKV
ncbi:N-acetylmuramoyl-L-alanine amidase [Patescibacteria group bacterium]|nr:N-acetylmuramoyl-L-alanine amidase [Patescibacteria group bacterium]